MNQSDAYYRALLAYKRLTAEQRDCRRDSHAFAEAEGTERVTVTRMTCTVDEAWIDAIEAGLIHIEKAIKEERQFIYSNGEVIPIEKVKQVSKDSVEHLARHAELITRAPEGEDLIPDKLYTVERLSDYAVYENRFLYMLLCYLRDFVTLRYQKIVELTGRYEGHLFLDREIHTFGRTVTVKLDLDDCRQDDPYLREHNPAKALIDRMDLILKTILAFLATPLMESAGKAALLKPPITKTNVLKMDNNFKGAVALYDYIIAYEGDGYTVTEENRELSPFGDALREDMAEAELLLAHLTYRYGLELTPSLKANLERDENTARLEAEQENELRHRREQAALLDAHAAEKASWAEMAEAERAAHREEIAVLREEISRKQAELDRFAAAYDELTDEKRLLHAQVLGQRAMKRGVTLAEMETMTDKDSFDELERELEAFVRLYESVWKQTKRKIRKDLLNPKYIKGQSGRK